MIDLPPLQSTTRPSDTAEQLAATCAEMLAHLCVYCGTELAKHEATQNGEQLLDMLHRMVGELHELSNRTSGDVVREVLDVAPGKWIDAQE